MCYLFHNSNSINDFIDPVLSLVLSHSQPNETQKQAISSAWQCGGAAPEREPPPLPVGVSGDAMQCAARPLPPATQPSSCSCAPC